MKDGASQAVDCYVRQLLVAIAAAFRSLLRSSLNASDQLASKSWFSVMFINFETGETLNPIRPRGRGFFVFS